MKVLLEIADGGLLQALSTGAARLGHFGLVLGAIAIVAFVVVLAVRTDSLIIGLGALAVPVVFSVLQYGDWKFLELAERVVNNTPTKTSGMVLYQLVGFVLVLAAAASFLFGAYLTLMMGFSQGVWMLASFIAAGVYLAIVGLLFLTPAALNLQEDHTSSAGGDGLSLIGTLIKAGLAAARLVFGFLCCLGAAAASIGVAWYIADSMEPRAWAWFFLGATNVTAGALYPIVIYVVSVLYYIILDVLIGVIRHTHGKS